MPIIRVSKHQHNFLIMDKTGLNDERLSYRARGILAFLLAKPDTWTIRVDQLVRQSQKDGKAAIMAALKELEALGYAQRDRIRGSHGKMQGWVTTILEVPDLTDVRKSDVGTDVRKSDVGTDVRKTDVGKSDIGLLDLKEVSIDSSKDCKKDPEVSIERARDARASRQLPDDWTISAPLQEWAHANFPYVPLDFEAEKFRDHYRANGKTMKDWDAAFRNWLRRTPAMALKSSTPSSQRKLVH